MSPLWGRPRGASTVHRFHSATLSLPGSYAVNEDAGGEAESGGLSLHVLADGLGGHARGEVGAHLAVEHCLARFRAHPTLNAAALVGMVVAAHHALRAAAQAHGDGNGVKSTLVVLALNGSDARWAHVGDSRLYHFRGGRIRSRTRDHSVPEMLHRAGEIGDDEIRGHPDRNRLLQVLGQETPPRVTVSDTLSLEPGDAFLLCSDGWWEGVHEDEMEAALAGAPDPQAWLARMRERIEAAAPTSQDNYTAVAVIIG
jgi:PPM family protein phosphatase